MFFQDPTTNSFYAKTKHYQVISATVAAIKANEREEGQETPGEKQQRKRGTKWGGLAGGQQGKPPGTGQGGEICASPYAPRGAKRIDKMMSSKYKYESDANAGYGLFIKLMKIFPKFPGVFRGTGNLSVFPRVKNILKFPEFLGSCRSSEHHGINGMHGKKSKIDG